MIRDIKAVHIYESQLYICMLPDQQIKRYLRFSNHNKQILSSVECSNLR